MESLLFQKPRSRQITLFTSIGVMLTAISLDNQFCRKTTEINDIRAKNNLPPEMCVFQREPMTQRPP